MNTNDQFDNTAETRKIEPVPENNRSGGTAEEPARRRRRTDKYADSPAAEQKEETMARTMVTPRVPVGRLQDSSSAESAVRREENRSAERRTAADSSANRFAGRQTPSQPRVIPEVYVAPNPYARPQEEERRSGASANGYPGSGEYRRESENNRGWMQDSRRDNMRNLSGRPVVRDYTRMNQDTGAIEPKKSRKGLTIALCVLLALGVLLVAVALIPEDAPGLPGQIKTACVNLLRGVMGEKPLEPVTAESVTVNGNTGTAPTEVIFTVVTKNRVVDVRLVDEDGQELETEQNLLNNTESNIWTLLLAVTDGYEGPVRVQLMAEDPDEWVDAGEPTELFIAAPVITATPEPVIEVQPTVTAEPVIVPAYTEQPTEEPEVETPEPTAEPTPEPTPEPTATPEPTPEPTPTPVPTATPALEAKADESASAMLMTDSKIYDGTKVMTTYNRSIRETVSMPIVGEYTRTNMGILTFRGDAFRQNAAVGTVTDPASLEVVWTAKAGVAKGSKTNYYGIGWTGQPLIVKWSKEVRSGSNIKEAKKETSGLKEVIVAGIDGNIYFLDLADGEETRNPIKVGYPLRGTPTLHPSGYPLLMVGQYARKMKSGTGKIGLRSYNLYNQKELTMIDGLDGKMKRPLVEVGSFETSPLIDRTTDTMITAGTNGLLYVTKLNSSFDYQQGTYSMKPTSIVANYKAKNEKAEQTSVEASVAMYDHYVYYADMGGILRCTDTSTMSVIWAVDTGDSVESTVALELEGDNGLNLYTANELSLRKTGAASVRKVNALTGKVLWTYDVDVKKDTKNNTISGFRASPVVGRNELEDLVYYTVTGLSDGNALGTGSDKAALIALDKETGKPAWSYGLEAGTYSSPVAVYDENGNGWIVQAAGNGVVYLLEGLTGKVVAEVKLEGNIEASPAVYGDMIVIGTTSKDGSGIYGIRINGRE